MLKQVTKACNSVAKVIDIAIILLFIALIVSCVLQVFSRKILNNSYPWTEELARYSFIWVHFLGSTICIRFRNHATITMVKDALPGNGQKILDLLISAILIIASVVLLYGGIKMAQMTGNQVNAGLKIPMSFVYISAAFSGAINLLYIFELILKDFYALIGKQDSVQEGGLS
jgi:TRAP-type C4-dicarboxylate transport system permease small subunit